MKPIFATPAAWLAFSLPVAAHAQRAQEVVPRSGLPNVFAKLTEGKEVRIAYLGESVTSQAGWRVLSLQWFQKQFPHARVSEINAAVSGTASLLGAFRTDRDVLHFHPDLVFVEFAVNDRITPPDQVRAAMEGIVRKIWRADPTTDICFIYTFNETDLSALEAGLQSKIATISDQVADYYGIPSIDFGPSIAARVKDGSIVYKGPLPATFDPSRPMVYSGDGTHPYEKTGHLLWLESLVRAMKVIRTAGTPGPHDLKPSIEEHNLENATAVPVSAVHRTGDWHVVSLNHDGDSEMPRSLPEVWAAEKPGDSLFFDFDGTLCGIFGVKGPDAAQFTVQIDNRTPISATLFDVFSKAHRYRMRPWFSPTLSAGHHHVVISLTGVVPNKDAILHQPTAGDPEFSKSILYIGEILINGSLLPPS